MTETSASKIFDLRRFYYYESGNIFTGSKNDFNFKIVPDTKEKTLILYIWHGKLCSELAEMDSENSYPLTQEGFDEMIAYLEKIYTSEKQ